MKTSESIVKISSAMAATQAKMKPVAKDGINTFFKSPKHPDGSPYATLDNIIEATKEALTEYKLAVLQAPVFISEKAHLITRIIHESGEFIEVETPLLLKNNDMQSLGAATTYAKRFVQASLFNISSDPDDDGNVADGRTAATKPNSAPKAGDDKKGSIAKAADVPKDNPYIFRDGPNSGKKFSDFIPEDFDALLLKYKNHSPKSDVLTTMIKKMELFKKEKVNGK